MIDLHIHLSGSLRPTTIIEYAKEKHISLPTYNAAELEEYLKAPAHCADASEFYDLCDMNDWILQERRSIRRAMMELVRSWTVRAFYMRKSVFRHRNVPSADFVRQMQWKQLLKVWSGA